VELAQPIGHHMEYICSAHADSSSWIIFVAAASLPKSDDFSKPDSRSSISVSLGSKIMPVYHCASDDGNVVMVIGSSPITTSVRIGAKLSRIAAFQLGN